MGDGGLRHLQTRGAIDYFLTTGTGLPSFFTHSIPGHTPFGFEHVRVRAERTDVLADKSVQVTYKVKRVGDLLSHVAMVVRLPEVYCDTPQRVRWVPHPGETLIQDVKLVVGNAVVQEFPGDWMHVKSQLSLPAERLSLYNKMIGHVPKLVEPELASGVYPFRAPGAATPSLPATRLVVPLPFTFSEDLRNALPLVAMQNDEVSVVVTLRSLRDMLLLWYTPPGEDTPGFHRGIESNPFDDVANFVAVDGNGRVDVDLHFEAEFVVLSDVEREWFSKHSHDYLVEQVDCIRFDDVGPPRLLDLRLNRPTKELVFFLRETGAVEDNGWTRFTADDGSDLLQSFRLVLNGKDYTEERGPEELGLLQVWRRHRSSGAPGIYTLPFCKDADSLLPTGHITMGRINKTQAQVLPVDGKSVQVTFVVRSHNFLRIMAGSAKMAFS